MSALNNDAPIMVEHATPTESVEPIEPAVVEVDMTGVIFPPPNIRKIVDKTASYAYKHKALEDKIRETNKGDPKFSFLNGADPYHPYYRAQLKRFRLGLGPSEVPDQETGADASNQVNGQGGNQDNEKDQSDVKLPPTQPPPFQFKTDMPPIPTLDLDTIKLTALYVARNGKQFLSGLLQRESRNHTFDFLKTGHHMFPYFYRLVDQYSIVFHPTYQQLEALEQIKSQKFKTLERVMQRVEYSLYEEEERKKVAEREDKERIAFASIDWHDFVVVQTLEFDDSDAKMDLPPPSKLDELISSSMATRKAAALSKRFNLTEDTSAPLTPPSYQPTHMQQEVEEEDRTERGNSPPPTHMPPIPFSSSNIKIKRDYVTKIGSSKAQGEATQVCPICNRSFPSSEIEEHMRIEKLDPKAKIQREIAEAKQKSTNLLRDNNDIAKNLQNMAAYRSDLFGSDEVGIGKKIDSFDGSNKDRKVYDAQPTNNPTPKRPLPMQTFPNPPQFAPMPNMMPPLRPFGNNGMMAPPPMMPPPHFAPPSFPHLPRPPFPMAPPPMMQPPMSNQIPPPRSFMPPPAHLNPLPSFAGNQPKKPKLDKPLVNLVPENQWIEMNPHPIQVIIQIPNDPTKPEYKLQGQNLVLDSMVPKTTIGELKDLIASHIDLPSNKQKLSLSLPDAPNLVAKNQYSLADYNLTDSYVILLGVKERGGKK